NRENISNYFTKRVILLKTEDITKDLLDGIEFLSKQYLESTE
ncbi:10874_t:CDS:1, partial [Scutellospora calospora]